MPLSCKLTNTNNLRIISFYVENWGIQDFSNINAALWKLPTLELCTPYKPIKKYLTTLQVVLHRFGGLNLVSLPIMYTYFHLQCACRPTHGAVRLILGGRVCTTPIECNFPSSLTAPHLWKGKNRSIRCGLPYPFGVVSLVMSHF